MTLYPESFVEQLNQWLKVTKNLPKYSRKLANFVLYRKAFRVFYIKPLKGAWNYDKWMEEIKDWPVNRWHPHYVIFTDREEPMEPRDNRQMHYLVGQKLWVVLEEGGSARVSHDWHQPEQVELIDITIPFWETYMQVGRCTFDYDHREYGCDWWRGWGPESNDDKRWDFKDSQTCRCKWCGTTMHLHQNVEVKVSAVRKWKHVPVAFGKDTFRCSRCHRPHPISDLYQPLPGKGAGKVSNLCPGCFLVTVVNLPALRRQLLPKELRKRLKKLAV